MQLTPKGRSQSHTLFSPPFQLTLSNSLDYISFEFPRTLHWTHTARTMNPDLLHKSPLQLGTIMNSNKADSDSLMQHTASPMTSSGNEDFKQDHTTRASAERPKAHSPPTGQFRCCIHQLQCPQITPSVNITKKNKKKKLEKWNFNYPG